jgi:molecular chaperone DnaK (HSP70)
MAQRTRPAIGLSVGNTALAAVTADNAVTRRPVLTLYRHRHCQVGVPAENPNLNEPGLVITDFVNRVGDPVAIVATDGSKHRGQALLADGLRALMYAAISGTPLPEVVAVSYPAHWSTAAADALRSALSRVPEWSRKPLLVSDVTAALTALRADPGVPAHGIIAVCDFGGSASSITLVDAADGCRRVGVSVRHRQFSGEVIDQAVLNRVLGELSADGSLNGCATAAIGSLTRLRMRCRRAKEQLSVDTAVELSADLPGYRGEMQLSRADLDEAIRGPLDIFIGVLRNVLGRNRASADLVAVAAVGGGASIPVIGARLSQQFRVPVITTRQPQLAAAVGAAALAGRDPVDDSQTSLTLTGRQIR